jgi:hypothetical protein
MAKKGDAKPTAGTPGRRAADSESPSLRASAPPRLKASALVDTRFNALRLKVAAKGQWKKVLRAL